MASAQPTLDWEELPDFSHAGYMGGGVAIPDVPVQETVSPGEGDDTALIQEALDQVGALPVQEDGFRGAVLLSPGTYELSGELRMDENGVVLRGSGEDQTILLYDGPGGNGQVIRVGGAQDDNWGTQVEGSLEPITSEFVELGSYSMDVEDASGFSVGDEIVIWHQAKSAWFDQVEQGGVIDDVPWEEQDNWRDVLYRRIITSISNNRITVDAPVFMDLDASVANLWIFKYDRPEYKEFIGVEDLTIDIVTESETDETQIGTGIYFLSVDNSWARGVTVKHFWSNGFRLSGTVYVTIEDCRAIEPHSELWATRRYNFVTSAAQMVLFKDCFASGARHGYSLNGHTSDSGVVFLNCESSNDYGTGGSHQRWATGLLFDNLIYTNPVEDKPNQALLLGNAGDNGNAHGWTCANAVAWRCDVSQIDNRIVLQDPPGPSKNYAIACIGEVEGLGGYPGNVGHIEFAEDVADWPQSLYEAQLERRLLAESDTQAPSTPENLALAELANNVVELSWDASNDDIGIDFYTVLRNGELFAETTATSLIDDSLEPDQSYAYSVAAVDVGGNESPASAEATFDTGSDLTQPTAPSNLSATASSSLAINLQWSPSVDDYAIAFYEIYVDGSPIEQTLGTSFQVSGLSPNTAFTFHVVAFDFEGRMSEASNEVDTATPSSAQDVELYLGMPFEESSGGTTTDVSSNAFEGTLQEGTTRTDEGKYGRAIEFDGVDGCLDLGNIDVSGSEITLAAWIKPGSFGISDGRIISKAEGVAEDEHVWMLSTFENQGIKARFRLKTESSVGTNTLVGNIPLSAGVWTHVAATYDGVEMRLFVNGALDTELPARGQISQSPEMPASIGNQPQGSRPFHGTIDDVRIYTRALSEAELGATLADSLDNSAGPDTDAPAVPTALAVTRISESVAELEWTASTDNVAVSGYRIYRDDTAVGVAATNSYTDTELATDQSYTYEVAALDAADNESDRSTEAVADAWELSESPTVPSGVVATALSTSQVKLTWEGSSDDGVVSQYRIYRDASLVGASTGLSFVDSDLSPESTHSYQVQAVDNEDLASELSEAVEVTTLSDTPTEPEENALLNGGFEDGLSGWTFFTSGVGDAAVSSPSYTGDNAAVLTISSTASNIQLYQNDLSLLPNTRYVLTFAAYSNTGSDLRVSLNRHTSPYTNYGLSRERVDLGTEWKVYTLSFTTQLFDTEVSDGRLYFWLSDDASGGDVFYIDQIALVPQGANSLTVETAGEGSVSTETVPGSNGGEVELTATPEPGWVFDHWAGDVDSTENPLTVQLQQDTQVYALFLPVGGDSVIDVWYGDEQTFGAVGIPQPQINILGNVQIPSFIESLEYSLNGVNRGSLTMGPEANIRHGNAGDFNIEIPYTSLTEGKNEVVIAARGVDGTLYSETVTVNSSIYRDWPIPYEVDWSQLNRIDEIGQVVDGKWELTEGGVRSVESAYDRLIALGDIEWTDYEVTVPITVHEIDDIGAPMEPLVGVMLRWNGHSLKSAREQPGTEWKPIGAIGAYGWYEGGYRGGPRFHILETGIKKSDGYEGVEFPLGETYYFKFRVETPTPDAPGLYSLKVWPEGESEPEEWGVTRQADEGLLKGSLMLVSHYVDATFGNVLISPVGEDTRAPTRPVELVADLLEGAEVSLSWAESSDESGIAFYRVLRNGEQIADVESNGYLDTTVNGEDIYRYQVLAVDEVGNSSEPSELVTVWLGEGEDLNENLWLGLGFEETSGTPVVDSSLNENDGTLVPEALRSSDGKFGNAIRFNGLSGSVSLGNLDIPSDTVTVSAWIFPESFATVDSRILSKANGVNEEDHYWMLSSINDGGIKARVRLKVEDGTTVTLVGGTVLELGQWIHLAFTYDGSELRLYVNGVLDGSMPLTGAIGRNDEVPVAIGDQPQGNRSFYGLIDEVRIFTKSFTEEEIPLVKDAPLVEVESEDTDAPSVPAGLAAEVLSPDQIKVTWQSSSDNVGIATYKVFRNETLVGQVTERSFTDSGIATGGTFDYSVSAVDLSGNESVRSDPVSVEVAAGNQPPTVPLGLMATGLSDSEIHLNWQASNDDGSISMYRVFRDDLFVGTSITTTYVDAGLSTTTTYSYQVAAVDNLSLVSDKSEVAEGSTIAASEPGSGGNAIVNGGFEEGLSEWRFYTSGAGDAAASSPGFAGSKAASLNINARASNIQLYQNDIALRPNTEYRLAFAAYCSSGNDLRVSLGKHASPYTNYGLNRASFDLGADWQSYEFEFVTKGFNSEVIDGRIFFWLAADARAGDVYQIDKVILAPVDEGNPLDSEPPSVPQALAATFKSGPKVDLSWQASTDEFGVSYYRILRNGAMLADVSNTSFADRSVLAGYDYSYVVVAYDASGNASEVSESVSVSTGSSGGENVINNASFEDGFSQWTFYTNGEGSANAGSPSYSGTNAAVLSIVNRASNIQLFQNAIELEPNARYRLRFSAFSNSGRNLRVSLGKHSSPYDNYGLNRETFDLTQEWQTFSFEFTTKNLTEASQNGRLFFWLADDARAGDVFYIDAVELVKL